MGKLPVSPASVNSDETPPRPSASAGADGPAPRPRPRVVEVHDLPRRSFAARRLPKPCPCPDAHVKGPSRVARDPESNKSVKRDLERTRVLRSYDDGKTPRGETLWLGIRGPDGQARARLAVHRKKRFFEIRIERLVDGKWFWTPKGCAFGFKELAEILQALLPFVEEASVPPMPRVGR